MNDPQELIPVEPDQPSEIVKVTAEGDPEAMLKVLEKKAALANRMKTAIETILISQTYPEDWTIQGDKACLGSAGTERIGRNFPIEFRDVKHRKDPIKDDAGEGYSYTYEGYAAMEGREVFAQGTYSTRDKFLGSKSGEWKPVEDINEGHIRNAAFHIFNGNAIKALLGLRNLPKSQYERIMGRTGQDAAASSTVTRGQGTQGGSSQDDQRHQKELGEICMAIANAGRTVTQDDQQNWVLVPIGESDERTPLEIAQGICRLLSSFEGKDGLVEGKPSAKALRGKWLNATLGKARKLREVLDNSDPNF